MGMMRMLRMMRVVIIERFLLFRDVFCVSRNVGEVGGERRSSCGA